MNNQDGKSGRRLRALTWDLLPSVLVIGTLTALGLYMTAYKIDLVRDVRFVGHADAAAYAEMGRSLTAGRGFHVRHVTVFFIPYSPGIERREDHWPPFMGMAIAPAFRAWGIDAWSAKAPAILIGSIGLPVATALLAIAFSGKAYVGLFCGLMMMSSLSIFSSSLTTLCDVAIAMLLAFFLAAVLGARRWPWLHVAAGVLLALAFYTKGSALALIPLYPLIAFFACGMRALRRKWTWYGVAAASLCILPWLATNWAYYGDPMHSTQNFVSGYIGFGNWDRNFYRVHWGANLPRTSDRWKKYEGRYPDVTRRNAEAFTRWALLGPGAGEAEWYLFGRPGAWLHQRLAREGSRVRKQRAEEENYGARWGPVSEWNDPVSAFAGIGTLIYLAALLLAAPLIAVKVFLRELKAVFTDGAQQTPSGGGVAAGGDSAHQRAGPFPAIGSALAILLVMLWHWAFIVFLWESMSRFAYVFMPATAVFAATGAARLLETVPALASFVVTNTAQRIGTLEKWLVRSRMKKLRWVPVLVLCLAVFFAVMNNTGRLKDYHERNVNLRRYPYRDGTIYPQLGDWLHVNLPEAVIMARRPWQLRFHSPDTLKAVGLPYAPPEQILGIGWYYGITHYLNDMRRPGMEIYVDPDNPHPAFGPVGDAPGRLFKIHWDKLEPGTDYRLPAPDAG